MGGLIYIIDTNVISDRINRHPEVIKHLTRAGEDGHLLGLCYPVKYEVLRGLLKVNATQKLRLFRGTISPLMDNILLTEADWELAAQLWAEMRRQGKQLADTDLLLAALAQRLNGIVVTADDDFDALSIQRENWRLSY